MRDRFPVPCCRRRSSAVLALLALFTSATFWPSSSASAEESAEPPSGVGPDAAWRAAARWDTVDETATEDIHRYTTDPRYLTPLVSYIPESATVPSPRDILGYTVGTEGELTRPDDEYRYFEALAAATPRVQIEEMGKTEEGRRMIAVILSSEETMASLGENRALMTELADPRRTDRARADEILDRVKPVMHITAGLHSPETGPPEMVMELAYRLAVSEHPDIREIRDGMILLITPVTEVDGRARMVEWYERYLSEITDRRFLPSISPPYWGAHAYHDNNRDGIQMTLALTQHYNAAFHRWHPVYSLDLHESVPLLYVSTGTGPYNLSVDPITVSEWQWAANWELSELNKHGLPGVWTWGFYTGWNPSYLLWVTNNHNSMGRFYETFGNASARTMERDLSDSRDVAGQKITDREWYRANPPDETVTWSLRNNTNYMQSGVLASLVLTARNGRTLLDNFWHKGRNSIQRGRTETPHAFVIPAEQRAPDRLAYLIAQLGRHHIEVERATAQIELDGDTVGAGDYVVRLGQPYGDFARNLLADVEFPKDAKYRPYDDVSWTLRYLYKVDYRPIDDPAILEAADLEPVTAVEASELELPRGRAGWAIPDTGQNTLIGLRTRLARFEALAAEESFEAGDQTLPAGTLLFPRQADLAEALADAARAARVQPVALREMPSVATHEVDLPRVALYHNWVATQPDGWVRYTLDQAGVEYDYINDDRIRAGDLDRDYDVILIAHQGAFTNLKRMVHGRDSRFGPMPYAPTDEFPSHGTIDSSPDITGGFGFSGLVNLEAFLDSGGTLMLLGSAGLLATEGGLVRNVSSTGPGTVNTPGSTLQVKVTRRDHPIAYGYDDVHWVFRTNGPVYSVPEEHEGWIVVQYGVKPAKKNAAERDDDEGPGDESGKTASPAERVGEAPSPGPFLLTGYVTGQETLERKGVVLDVPRHDGGRVLLYSFNPLHRYLNHGDFAYVFNALLHWNDLPEPAFDGPAKLAKD